MNIRKIVRNVTICLLTMLLVPRAGAQERGMKNIFIVHTSDSHSCVEPLSLNFSDTLQAGKGGFLRRAVLLDDLRAEHPDLLLFDCGDYSQGSVYYNLFHGEVEIRLMNMMHYSACTIGNHEFDFGLENMARLFRMAEFPVVCCNYDFSGTPCQDIVHPYIVLERDGLRIGVVGVSPKLESLVAHKNYGTVRYMNPVTAVQQAVDKLRGEERCDFVICLSHLGYGNREDMDSTLVSQTTGIDIILGGHTHSYFETPMYLPDKEGKDVLLNHMGKNARFVGTLEIELD